MNKTKIINFSERYDNYFEPDIWDLTIFPEQEIAEIFQNKFLKYRTLDFSIIKSDNKKRELKLFFKAYLKKETRIKFYEHRSIFYFPLITLANTFDEDSFLTVDIDALRNCFEIIIKENHINKQALAILPNFIDEIYELTDTRTKFDRDIWHLDDYKISKERMNLSTKVNTLYFRDIENETNREYVKVWVKYLIGCTEFQISTIMNRLSKIKNFFNTFPETNAEDITSDDIAIIIEDMEDEHSNNDINKMLNSVDMFYKYWETRQTNNLKSPVLEKHFRKDNYVPADNLVSENVILQIFRKLHTLPLQEMVMFLINYSAGLRISDICQIKRDGCLFFDGNDGYYLVYDCQKMRKSQRNQIPKALYEYIEKQQHAVGDSKYLFPSSQIKGSPIRTGSYAKKINRWIAENNIINDDGTPYVYRSHAFRHSLATDLLQTYNVDLQVIQLAVLQHKEIQMTLTYAQRSEIYNMHLHDQYITNYGDYSNLDITDASELNKKALGNGYCNYPDRLGTCPYSDICLNCEFFRTSIHFLDIHKKHLEELRKNIITFEANGWLPNAATARETEKKLIKIIETLENIK